jgi:hypothetical protein
MTLDARHRRPRPFRREADLYGPVKRFLEAAGWVVKAEVEGCDVVGVRGEAEPPVVVELKLAFTLGLLLQGVDRLALTELVYLALPAPAAARPRGFSPHHPSVRRLCRRLGLGLLAVRPPGEVEIVLEPEPVQAPRRKRKRVARVLLEHRRRQGDPNEGGANGRPLVTAYRQEALRCAELLRRHGGGPLAVAAIRAGALAPAAQRILHRNVYGWFERAGRGLYRLTPAGSEGLAAFAGSFDPPRDD